MRLRLEGIRLVFQAFAAVAFFNDAAREGLLHDDGATKSGLFVVAGSVSARGASPSSPHSRDRAGDRESLASTTDVGPVVHSGRDEWEGNDGEDDREDRTRTTRHSRGHSSGRDIDPPPNPLPPQKGIPLENPRRPLRPQQTPHPLPSSSSSSHRTLLQSSAPAPFTTTAAALSFSPRSFPPFAGYALLCVAREDDGAESRVDFDAPLAHAVG